MAGGKETPRQKMIGMMYLVLTALLAMNVSKSVLDAFVVVNNGLQKTNANFENKNAKTYQDFEAALTKDPAKTQYYYEKAKKTRELCGSVSKHIDDLKVHLIQETDKVEKAIADTMKLGDVSSKDNYDIPTHIMIGPNEANPKEGEFTAKELKGKLLSLNDALVKLFDEESKFLPGTKKEMDAKLQGLKPIDFGMINGVNESWETGNFYHLPLAAVITNLSKIQNDIKNAEADVVTKLFSAVSGLDFKFDKLTAKVIAPSSYILQGDEYKADILLVAFNSSQSPKVIVGPIDTSKGGGEEVNPLMAGADTSVLPVEGGLGKYTVNTSSEGLQKWSGVIQVEKPGGGGFNYYPFSSEYMVAKPAAAVSPDKMNVFYIGVDNPVSITAAGVAPEQLAPSMSGGTISGSRGKYIVRVNSGSEATINVGAKFDAGTKSMGSFKFRVKRVPDPVTYFAGKKGDDIVGKGDLKTAQGIFAKLENFDFDLKFDVTEFVMSMNVKGVFVEERSSSNRLTPAMVNMLKNVGTNGRVFIEQVRVKGPDGTVRKIPGVSLKVK